MEGGKIREMGKKKREKNESTPAWAGAAALGFQSNLGIIHPREGWNLGAGAPFPFLVQTELSPVPGEEKFLHLQLIAPKSNFSLPPPEAEEQNLWDSPKGQGRERGEALLGLWETEAGSAFHIPRWNFLGSLGSLRCAGSECLEFNKTRSLRTPR